MSTLPIDPTIAMGAANQQDLVQKHMQMTSLRQRLGDSRTEDERLRESCEGFESIFIQKMWEQMRKNVPKEGYLHSKDEETYQSMFDVELSKKMTSAGGIGLADMLYEQLSKKNANAARTTVSSPMAATRSAAATAAATTEQSLEMPMAQGDKELTVENLYSELPAQTGEQAEPSAEMTNMPEGAAGSAIAENPAILTALESLRASLSGANEPAHEAMNAGAEQNAAPTQTVSAANPAGQNSAPDSGNGGNTATNQTATADASAPATNAAGAVAANQTAANQAVTNQATANQAVAGQVAANQAVAAPSEAEKASVIQEISNNRNRALLTSSWQGNGPVSAKPKPVSGIKSNAAAKEKALAEQKNTADSSAGAANAANVNAVDAGEMIPAAAIGAADASTVAQETAEKKSGMVPQETMWPHHGKIVSHFGWEDTGGGRRWNSGVEIAAKAGDPVKACLDGTVIYSGPREGYGHTVVLQHKDGYLSYYGNVAANHLKEGDTVGIGIDFASVDASPAKSANGENYSALHFELKRGEMALNPEKAIGARLTASR